MNQQLFVFLPIAIVCLGSLGLSLWIYWQKMQLKKELLGLQERNLELDRKYLDLKIKKADEPERGGRNLKIKANTEKRSEVPASEILELRKSVVQYKEDLQKTNAVLLKFEKESKKNMDKKEDIIAHLTEENQSLIGQAREAEQKLVNIRNDRTKDDEGTERQYKERISALNEECRLLKDKLNEREKDRKKIDSLEQQNHEKTHVMQQELRRWREAAALANGKTLDPQLYIRWFKRAQAGRDMYQFMKQLREMSDIKLVTYQEGLIRVCEFILAAKKAELPLPKEGEIKADRYLAYTLDAIHSSVLDEGYTPVSDVADVAQPAVANVLDVAPPCVSGVAQSATDGQ